MRGAAETKAGRRWSTPETLRTRAARVWVHRRVVIQAGSAAGLAWFLAQYVMGHEMPFFAPISAVLVLGASAGQRLRRTVELVVGVAVGIFVGDLLIVLFGAGPLQLALVVGLAVGAALFLGSGALLINQAAASAVLIATLYPPSGGIYYTRWLDALIGGAVAFGVHALLLPGDPLATVGRAVGPVLDTLAEALTATGRALREADPAAADATLAGLRATEPLLQELTDALAGARETVAVSPIRWGDRSALGMYVTAAPHLDHAVRNARVLARRQRAALRTGEAGPPVLAEALDELAAAVRALHQDLDRGRESVDGPRHAVRAARLAGEVYAAGVGLSTAAIAAQVRSVAVDLMLASGLEEPAAHTALDPDGGPADRDD
ncbi:FUSC family protein [Polymorphospora rubra]|uniref:FUSC family protein n=1 Tax=Polymorphospora rubra TaxID=338584 RepID=UPI0033C78354